MVTLIWFFPSMWPQMSYKFAVFGEKLITIATLIWFHPNMCSKVHLKITSVWKIHVTMRTLIGFLPFVSWDVFEWFTFFRECFATHVALICLSTVCVFICIWRSQFFEETLSYWLPRMELLTISNCILTTYECFWIIFLPIFIKIKSPKASNNLL